MTNPLFFSWVVSQCWAIDAEFAERAIGVLLHRANAQNALPDNNHGFSHNTSIPSLVTSSLIVAGSSQPTKETSAKEIMILPIHGTISHRISQVEGASVPSGISSERISVWLDTALANDAVHTIVLDIDSPGGMVAGTPELAEKIYNARSKKRIIAFANANAASAAYWIGTSASEFYVTPSGRVGSIGVLGIHRDMSEKMAKEGVKTTFIYAGEKKIQGNSFEPLSQEAFSSIQSEVNSMYQMFLEGVSKYRNVEKEFTAQNYGKGALLLASDALAAGMVDGIMSYEEVIYHATNASKKRNTQKYLRSQRCALQLRATKIGLLT